MLALRELRRGALTQVQLAAPFSSSDTPRSTGTSPRAPSPRTAAAAPIAAAETDAAEAGAAALSPQTLEMENARLRAELAAQVLFRVLVYFLLVRMPSAAAPSLQTLEMENARLRAELAAKVIYLSYALLTLNAALL